MGKKAGEEEMMEKTVILVKHDGIQRGLVGEVIKRFEQKGLKIDALKMLQPTKEHAEKQYRLTPEWTSKLAEKSRKAAEEKGQKIKERSRQKSSTGSRRSGKASLKRKQGRRQRKKAKKKKRATRSLQKKSR